MVGNGRVHAQHGCLQMVVVAVATPDSVAGHLLEVSDNLLKYVFSGEY